MPIFDFQCTKCEAKEERLVKHSEIDNQVCQCSGEMIKCDSISRTNFVLKGNWYSTTKEY